MLAAGAMVAFYHQGATVSAAAEIPANGSPVPVYVTDAGTFEPGSVGQVALEPEKVVRVTSVERGVLEVTSESGAPFTIIPWSRLVRIDERPRVFSDPQEMNALGTTIVASEGRVEAYVAAAKFDYVVSGGGLTQPRLHIDAVGGAIRSASRFDAREFPDLPSAVAALPALGGEILLPAGEYALNKGLPLNEEQDPEPTNG